LETLFAIEPLISGSFKADNLVGTSLVFSNATPPPPSGPFPTPGAESMNAAFKNVQPNGTWNLYVMDTSYPDSGSISSWMLFLQTGPEVSTSALSYTVLETNPVQSLSVPVTLSDSSTPLTNLTVTVTSGSQFGPVLSSSTTPLAVTLQSNSTTSGVTGLLVTPQLDYPSVVDTQNSLAPTPATNTLWVTVSDQSGNSSSTSFNFIVTYSNQPPVVTNSVGSAGLTINENSTVPFGSGPTFGTIVFTNSDVDSYLSNKLITVTSGNPAILANSGIVKVSDTIGNNLTPGNLGLVTYTITPVANASGTGSIIYSISDTNGNTVTMTVPLTVTHIYQPPTITVAPAPTSLVPGTKSTNINYTVSTVESGATLTVAAVSVSGGSYANPYPAGPNNIVITGPTSGAGTIQLIPVGAPSSPESSTISIIVTQVAGSSTLTATNTFNIQLGASPATLFANTLPIGNTVGNPVPALYPSPIADPGLVGNVASVSVQLNAFSASDPSDVSIVLQAPNQGTNPGPSVMLMSGAGGTTAASDLTLTFADVDGLASPTAPLAANGGSAAYAPSIYPSTGVNSSLPTNAPAAPYFDQMAAFKGINPNGTWNLWVVDRTLGQTNLIANGWTLSITTGPTIGTNSGQTFIGTPPALVITENVIGGNNTGTVLFNVQDSTGEAGTTADQIVVTGSPSSLLPASSIGTPAVVGGSDTDENYSVAITPPGLASGLGSLTFTVTRSDGAQDSFTLPVSVTKINLTPIVTANAFIHTVNTIENTTGSVEFYVTELGDPLSDVWIGVTSSNPNLITSNGFAFQTGQNGASPGEIFPTNVINLGAGNNAFETDFANNPADVVLLLTPVAKAVSTSVGSSTITLYVTNIDNAPGPEGTIFQQTNAGAPSPYTFTFTTTTQLYPPQFSTNPPGILTLNAGSSTAVTFQFSSQDNPLPSLITVTSNSSAPLAVSVGPFAPNGSTGLNPFVAEGTAGATTWTVPITALPTTTPGNAATITLTATDSYGSNVTANIQVYVVPNQGQKYTSATPINIGVEDAAAAPAPTTNMVEGLVGLVSQVVVTLNNFSHTYPQDVGVMLVGPGVSGESNTVLMNSAGFAYAVTDQTLTFSNSPTPPGNVGNYLPQFGQLETGVYLPSDYYSPKPYNFLPGPVPAAPNGPYPTNLEVFNGASPDGAWYLYAQDDSFGDVGSIGGGWTLTIVTRPQIAFAAETSITVPEVITVPENTGGAGITGHAGFTIWEDSAFAGTNYSASSFGVSSTNTALIPTANITLLGTSTNWTASFTSALNAIGTDLITVFATNSYSQVASNSFIVVVQPVFVPPVIAQPATVSIPAGTATTIPLVYSDLGFNANELIASATFSALPVGSQSPIGSLSFVPGVGNGPSNLYITTVGNSTGSALITLIVTNPVAGSPIPLSATNTFIVNIEPSAVPLSYQPGAITINNDTVTGGRATPYPSPITVLPSSGVGNIYKVTVTLLGFAHTYPANVSALLVGPGNQSVMLMSGEGNDLPVSNLRLTFDDAGGTMSAAGPITSGTYAPALSDLSFIDGQTDVQFPTNDTPPAPFILSEPYGHDLSVFSNTSPTGTWSLFVYDDAKPDVGLVTGGWLLSIETIAPMASPIGAVAISENTTTNIPFSVASASTSVGGVSIVASASAESPTNLVASLVISGQGTSSETLTITPTTNFPSAANNTNGTPFIGNGQATITLVLTNTVNNTSSTNSFQLTVLRTDIPPVITLPAAATNTPANITLTVPITISDVQGTSDLAVTASLTPDIGTVGITTNGGGSYALIFTPDGATTTATASIVATDGTVSSTNTIAITVTAGLAPAVTIVSATNTPENSTLAVPFIVANVPATFSTSSITAVASNTNLVASVGVKGVGSNFTAIIMLAPYTNGNSTITITANDQYGTGTNSMTLTVTRVEYPPTLAPITNQTTLANTPLIVVLNVTDAATSITNLTYSALNSSTNVIGAVNFSFNGANEIATIVPAANKIGVAAVTITVGDGVTNVSQAFAVTVTQPTPPTLEPIAGQSTTANTPLQVALNVISPETPIANLTFSGSTTNTNVVESINFSVIGTNAVAVITPVTNALGVATVTISVNDPFSTSSQSFTVTVAGPVPVITIVSATNTPENSTLAVPFTLVNVPATFSPSSISAVASNTNLVASVGIAGVGSNFTATITLVPYKNGSSTIALTADGEFGTNTAIMTLTVTPVEYPPTLAPIPNTNTPANTPVIVVLNVTDAATSITNLVYSANIGSPTVVAAVNFSFNGANEIATIVPATNKAGASLITITVGDGVTNVSQAFTVTVIAPTPPTLGAIASQFTAENTALQVVLNVTSPVTPVTNLTFSGSSTNTSLVKGVTFAFNGTSEVATVTPVTNATGLATVTISVNDPYSTNSQSFALQISAPIAPTLTATLVNGALDITFTGTPGVSYSIQSSSNLETWTTVATMTANASTGAVAYDAAVSTSGAVFYRAVAQ
jgi:subtilisin-like proprotein convertase family protein